MYNHGYVLGADFAEISDDEIARRLATYTYVASQTDFPKLYRAFGFAQLPEGVDEIQRAMLLNPTSMLKYSTVLSCGSFSRIITSTICVFTRPFVAPLGPPRGAALLTCVCGANNGSLRSKISMSNIIWISIRT